MKKTKKLLTVCLAAAMVSSLLSATAFADSRTKIGKIHLNVHADFRIGDSGGDVDAMTTTEHVYVDDVEVVNDDVDSWSRTNTPVIKITLSTDEDEYYFSSTSSSNFKLNLSGSSYDDIKFKSANKSEKNSVLTVTARLTYGDYGAEADKPGDASWDQSNNGVGHWGDSGNAKYYQLQLMRDGNVDGSTFSSYETSYNFAGRITQAGTYRFRVRAVESSTNDKSDWVTSGSWYVSAEEANQLVANSGSWQMAADNVRKWGRFNDGSWPSSQWMLISGAWYYFDASGYMCTGWQTIGGNSYYLDPSTGVMWVNQRTPDGYWVNQDGVWVPGA